MTGIILAAGMGTRLGHALPKCLTPISDGLTILDLQLQHLAYFVDSVIVVVGFKKELIMERHPRCLYAYNPEYGTTNTAYSLALALSQVGDTDTLWLNGDVVLNRTVIQRVVEHPQSSMATTVGEVGDEEVKYRIDGDGSIVELSKEVTEPLGEAVGVNLIRGEDIGRLRRGLEQCGRRDYFERGIEIAIADGLAMYTTDVTDLPCIEVDFPEDLAKARRLVVDRALDRPRLDGQRV